MNINQTSDILVILYFYIIFLSGLFLQMGHSEVQQLNTDTKPQGQARTSSSNTGPIFASDVKKEAAMRIEFENKGSW